MKKNNKRRKSESQLLVVGVTMKYKQRQFYACSNGNMDNMLFSGIYITIGDMYIYNEPSLLLLIYNSISKMLDEIMKAMKKMAKWKK